MRKPAIVQRLLLSLLLVILSSFTPVFAEAGLIVKQHWIQDTDNKLSPNQALDAFRAGEGKTVDNKVFKLGNTPSTIWIHILVNNQSNNTQSLRLLTGAPYNKLLQAYRVKSNQNNLQSSHTNYSAQNENATQFVTIIDEHKSRIFSERNNAFRLLNANPFELEQGEVSELLIKTIIEGPSYLPVSILSNAEFSELELADSVFAALFYGFTTTLGVLFLLFSLAVKHRIAILYAALFLIGLLVVADIDGYALKWLWPNSPQWNHISPLVILPLLNSLGFVIVHQLLTSVNSARFNVLKPIAIGLAMVSITLPAFILVLPPSNIIQIENLLSIPAFLLQPIAFISWLHIGRRSYFSLASVLVIGLLVATLVASVFLDLRLPDLALKHLHHFAYLIVGMLVMSIITVQLMGLQKDQQGTLERELALAQENAEINQSLLTAEQNYSRAQRLASQHQQQLASASHDLRQPIVSLRASIDAIAHNQTPEVRAQLKEAFDYLESLCSQHLQQTRPTAQHEAEPKKERYPASLILNTVQRMFTNEASSRGIALNSVPCDITLQQDPMVLMRIISNLVANAIKHHCAGANAKVILGCRRREDYLLFMVCDNGAGIAEGELALLQQPYQKTTDSDGEGLGLAIIYQLAKENGLGIECESILGKGTCFKLKVPR